MIGGEPLGAGTEGFGNGVLVAVGDGSGGAASAVLVGEGSAGFLFAFEFVLLLALRSGPPRSLGVSLAAGDGATVAVTFGAGVVPPPEGMPAWESPVAGFAGSTGLLFGSAANAEPLPVVSVGCELRVNA